MSETTITVRRENEFLLGVGEVLVAHGIHPEYGVPALTFTKAANPGKPGEEPSETELASLDQMNTMVLVFTTADAMNQHLARLETAMREMKAKAAAPPSPPRQDSEVT